MMNHIHNVESLLFIRGKRGVSISDLKKVINCNDFEYILYLISQVESRLESTVLHLKYDTKKKRFHVMIKPEFINLLQDLEIIKPRLSKAATATLSVIILYHFRNQKLDLDFLKTIRTSNVKEHLRELHESNYILFDEENETFSVTQKLNNEINLQQVAEEIERLYE